MPRSEGDSDSDGEDESALGLVMDRSSISSIASMSVDDRIELMEKVNKDLERKVAEAELTLMRKLADHEAELEEIQMRLEESKAELMAAKKEEKELRNKEVRPDRPSSSYQSAVCGVVCSCKLVSIAFAHPTNLSAGERDCEVPEEPRVRSYLVPVSSATIPRATQ